MSERHENFITCIYHPYQIFAVFLHTGSCQKLYFKIRVHLKHFSVREVYQAQAILAWYY